ncbi:hypothetical protein TREMEDRAFT_26330 [Tremella mesenterica DSM 1558]|uniref:uncharacterized protein n=1 Tax=Tremella mesenterica (strain ATCC 24925 / CBS 8224 / DSM 1558 / NBRC 9311 / NRRL Y-6157 / RJB 2259-6 / UBC 559-6) TaxID=578456 RepID=UPI0003F49AE3|nr:uncharacterized protein TREMEDRAFT_26330 [Tremella mesenterica DSM 1558]EIW72778.1 hypothetical protein TREMEDRAFT_26330 [Tremella mesenterica DSM 1558]
MLTSNQIIWKSHQMPQHTYLSNGLLKVNPSGRHPIYDLIARSREDWNTKGSSQSRTLNEAVSEYRRRYGRAPPKAEFFGGTTELMDGWAYVKKHNVQLPDEYDQIYDDIEPFFALTAERIKESVKIAKAKQGIYTIVCQKVETATGRSSECSYNLKEEGMHSDGQRIPRQRAEAQLSLLKDVESELEEVEAIFYSHDGPFHIVDDEHLTQDIVGAYGADNDQTRASKLGWASACPTDTPLRVQYDLSVLPTLEQIWNGEKSFVWNHKATMNPCEHPTLAHLSGALAAHGKGVTASKILFPVLAMCKTPLHSDILAVAMEAWTEDVDVDPPWEEKSDDRLLWRGSTTGIHFGPKTPWNISQRINLVSKGNQTTGMLEVFDVRDETFRVGTPSTREIAKLNHDLLDVAFAGRPAQCEQPTCDEMAKNYRFEPWLSRAEGNKYKYILDVDGNGWSARFKRLMTTNSLIFKATIFPEWYTARVQPWVHYVPLKADLTDMYDVFSFFRHNDHLAKEIATAGKIWSKTFWRHEDMVAYQFRLLLEYSRLLASDREKASYHGKGRRDRSSVKRREG